MIYEFRVKYGIKGVSTKHVDAPDLKTADTLAREWCDSQPGALYLPNSCEPWLITAPSQQAEAAAADLGDGVPGKPDLPEQRKRTTAQAAARLAGTGVGSKPTTGTERIGA